MIIFDLDGTLADFEHRRHFVDAELDSEKDIQLIKGYDGKYFDVLTNRKWKPDWKSFYEACDKDIPIQCVIEIWNKEISLGMMDVHEIWSGRCESVRKKTEKWLDKNLLCFNPENLKMAPIGNELPDYCLKELWLNEICEDRFSFQKEGKKYPEKHNIDFVFDGDPKSIDMFRRRGIFVFDCNQRNIYGF